jgi:hypothetical protein
VSRALIVGGHVLQGSTFVDVRRGQADRRLPWSHYLALPGVIETIGRVDRDDVVQGFTRPAGQAGQADALDLGAISGRVMDAVQDAPDLDHRPPFRMARTRLRWATTRSAAQETAVAFRIESETVRTVEIRDADAEPEHVAELCEDLALHDWLLTTLQVIIERSRVGSASRAQVVSHLRPAIDFLLHLWMPSARLDRSVAGLWDRLERRPGFTRQWNSSVARIRDQVAISTLVLFGALDDRHPVQ